MFCGLVSGADMDRCREVPDVGLEPGTKPQGEVLPSDVRKVIVGEEEQQEWSPLLDQQDSEHPLIKEEQEEAWSSPDADQPRGPQEACVTILTVSPVKSEDDAEEKPESSQHHRHQTGMKTEARSSDPESHSEPGTDKASDSSDTEVSDGDWEDRDSQPQSGQKCLKNHNFTVIDINCNIERSFSCSECGQRFGRKPHLKAHMRIHTGEKPFSCSFCGKRFSQKGNSISHMRLHTGEKPFSCSICKKSFRYSGDVSRHMKIHTGLKTGRNKVCDMVNSDIHVRSKPGRSLHPDTCLQLGSDVKAREPETDANQEALKESGESLPHVRSLRSDGVALSEMRSADKESFSCSECGRTFCRRDHLISHMRTHTGEKPFSCSVCEKRFSCSGNILAHMRIHTGEKPFECSFCGKSFSQKGTLQLHVRIHTGEKPFTCPFCDKRFAHKRRMTLHMSVHTEEKRFGCSACGKRFTWYTQLKTHKCVGEPSQLRQNQSEKAVPSKESFSCTECGKIFSLKGNLKTHMRIHTGEKPFGCSVCGKSFKQNVHLTEHMTIHTGEKLYNCSICGKGFNKKLLIKSHTCV